MFNGGEGEGDEVEIFMERAKRVRAQWHAGHHAAVAVAAVAVGVHGAMIRGINSRYISPEESEETAVTVAPPSRGCGCGSSVSV